MWKFAIEGLMAMGPAPAGTQQNPSAQTLQMVLMLGFFFVVMYFLMIRPQQKKAKEHANMVKNLKAGDRILTSGGIVGVVVLVRDRTLTLRTEKDTRVEVVKSAVTEVLERTSTDSKSE